MRQRERRNERMAANVLINSIGGGVHTIRSNYRLERR